MTPGSGDVAGVADQALRRVPQVKQARWWAEEGLRRGQRVGIDIAVFVQVRDAADERRMVHQQQRGLAQVGGQRGLQPGQACGVDVAVVLARRAGVERDEPDRVVVDAVVKRALLRKVGGRAAERSAKVFTPVMVAGNGKVRDRELLQQLERHGVFVRVPFVHRAAGQQDQVGAAIKPVQVLDGVAEHAVGVGHAAVRHAARPNADVRELGDQHRTQPTADTASGARTSRRCCLPPQCCPRRRRWPR